MKHVKYLIGQIKAYWSKIILAILSGVLKEIFVVSAVGICAYMAAILLKTGTIMDTFYLKLLFFAVLGRTVFSYLESFYSHDVSYHILVDFRVKLYDKFVTLCPDILLNQRSGQISTTLMNDVEVLEWFYAHTAGYVIVDSVLFIMLTVFLGSLHWILALLLIISVTIIFCIPFLMRRKADEQGRESRFRLGEANAVTLEGISGMNELLTLNAVEDYQKKNYKFMDALTKIQVQYAKRMGTEGGMLQIASGIAAVLINICGIWLVLNQKLSMEWYAVVGTTVWLVFAPILELCGMVRNFGIIFAASGRIANILSSEPIVEEHGEKVEISKLSPNVEFDKVSFRYKNTSSDVLHKVSFQVKSGNVLAIVGESGAGKTTCMHLLTRMWDVKSGSIKVGGKDIRDIRLEDLHHMISVVSQDVYLFNISIGENIRLGRPEATMQEVEEAAKMARVHDFIASLPEGYDTITGERGLQVSGGQRQRIAIARALLMDTPILIMDEAVSNLDTKTDQEIQRTIRTLARKKTILLVAHRLSTILEADEIVVMKDGNVLQKGTHEELMKTPGYYRKLVEAQY